MTRFLLSGLLILATLPASADSIPIVSATDFHSDYSLLALGYNGGNAAEGVSVLSGGRIGTSMSVPLGTPFNLSWAFSGYSPNPPVYTSHGTFGSLGDVLYLGGGTITSPVESQPAIPGVYTFPGIAVATLNAYTCDQVGLSLCNGAPFSDFLPPGLPAAATLLVNLQGTITMTVVGPSNGVQLVFDSATVTTPEPGSRFLVFVGALLLLVIAAARRNRSLIESRQTRRGV